MDSSTEIHYQSVEEEDERGRGADCDPQIGHLLQRTPSSGKFPVDKSRFCFLCTSTGEEVSGRKFSVQSIRCLFRYLKMDTKKKDIVARRGMGEGLRGPDNNCQFKVNLCEECASLNGQFTELYQQLERIQMEVGSCLERVETKLKAEMAPKYLTMKMPHWVQTVKGLRNEAVNKCLRKRKTWPPRVLVKKLPIGKVTKVQISLGREETREETIRKGQSYPDMDSLPCKAPSEAGRGPTVGEERGEVKTASSPPSKPHDASNDERPDSEATWSRASSSTDEEISKQGDALFLRSLLGKKLKAKAKEDIHKGGTKFCPDMDFSPCEGPSGAVTEMEIMDEIKIESSPEPDITSEHDATGSNDNFEFVGGSETNASHPDSATMTTTTALQGTILPSPIIEPSPMSVEEIYGRSSVIPGTAQFKCLTCGKVLSRKDSFLQHYKIVHLGVKYKCEICGKVFTTRSHYMNHFKSFHLNLRFECSACRKVFTDKLTYQQHYESVHLGGSKFKCGVCKKSYSTTRSLWRHQQSCQDNPEAMGKPKDGTEVQPEIDSSSSPCRIPPDTDPEIEEEEILNVSSPQPIPRDPLGDKTGEDEDGESNAFSLYEGRDCDSNSGFESSHSEAGEPKPAALRPDAATMTPKAPKDTSKPLDVDSSRSPYASENDAAEDEESDDDVSLYEARDSDFDSDSDSESSHSEEGEAEPTPPSPDPATMIAPKVTVKASDMDSSPCEASTETGPKMDEEEIKTESESLPQPKLNAGSEDDAATTAPKDNDTKKPSPITEPSPLSAKEIEERCSFNPETGKRKCKTCGRSYTERGGFIRHYKTVHLGLRVTCEICGKLFSETSKYLKHYKRVHLNILMDIDSSPCLALTGTGTGPEIHEEEIKTEESSPKPHPTPEDEDEDEPPPPDSATATMTTTTALKDTRKPSPIIESHPMPKEEILERCSVNPITERIKCRTCGKFYREKSIFIRHYRSAHLREKCKCEICGKVFAARGHYLKHFKKAHLDIRYECSVCKKSFSDRFTYQQHYKAVHMKVKSKCGVCNKSFSGKANLWIHEKYTCKDNPKAKGERPKPRPKKKKEPGFRQLCDECGKAFKSEGQFKRHVALELCKKDKDTDKEPVEKKKPGRKKTPVPEEGFSWVCHICGKVITSKKHKGHFAKHVKECKKRNGLTD